jgi:RHS repeat-associated protein
VPTDKKFTGQELDGTGLYYYGARYYDPTIGRFISADTIIPNPTDTQAFNRYSYCLNNPLKYIDPSGHDYNECWEALEIGMEIHRRITESGLGPVETSDAPIVINPHSTNYILEMDVINWEMVYDEEGHNFRVDQLQESINRIVGGGLELYVDSIDYIIMQIYGWTPDDIYDLGQLISDESGPLKINIIGFGEVVPDLDEDSAFTLQEEDYGYSIQYNGTTQQIYMTYDINGHGAVFIPPGSNNPNPSVAEALSNLPFIRVIPPGGWSPGTIFFP